MRVTSNAKSNNAFGLTYSVSVDPRYGTVTIDQETGDYFYKPEATLRVPGITDSFTIAVNNGNQGSAHRCARHGAASPARLRHSNRHLTA